MNATATENLSTPPLAIPTHPEMVQVAAAFNSHRDECDAQASTTDLELDRLQVLLDDSMNRLAGAFSTLASDAEARSHEEARDALVQTLQYHDVCSQLLGHARRRIAHLRGLIAALDAPFTALAAAAGGDRELAARASAALDQVEALIAGGRDISFKGPVFQTDLAAGEIELF